MGNVIRPKASIEKILEHGAATLRAAERRGGDVAEAAREWVGEPLGRIEASQAAARTAEEAVAAALDRVLGASERATAVAKATRDEMWNVTGRKRSSAVMEETFPGGVGTYVDGDPREQPVLLPILVSRIASARHPGITEERRAAWIAAIEATLAPLAEAVTALRAAEASALVASVAVRDLASTVAAGLARLKRQYQNMGLTEADIHSIIPDATRGSSRAGSTGAEAPPAPATGETGGDSVPPPA